VIRLSDLRGAEVKTVDGERLGLVHEVHTDKGRVTAVTCGPGSFIERLTAKKKGRRVPFECICRIERKAIVVTSDPPQRIVASRTRRGTRRTSEQPSKR
jgi:sporulation protein YlmC with PRC-barrel domain